MGPLRKDTGNLVTRTWRRLRLSMPFFTSDFTRKYPSQITQAAKGEDRNWESEELLTVGDREDLTNFFLGAGCPERLWTPPVEGRLNEAVSI